MLAHTLFPEGDEAKNVAPLQIRVSRRMGDLWERVIEHAGMNRHPPPDGTEYVSQNSYNESKL